MCGIMAIINHKEPATKEVVVKALSIMKHRGPDGSGVALEPGVALGHNRLAILDTTSDAAQPMERWDCLLTYNGEVYNYKELRTELIKKGYDFHSESDTEVILALYREYDVNMFKLMNGMWSFVLYDRREGKVLISRDRLGKKPLYWMKTRGGVVFSSEIKPIKSYCGNCLTVDESVARDFIKNGQDESRCETFYSGIYRFPAAHYLFCNAIDLFDNEIKGIAYWDLNVVEDGCKSTIDIDKYSEEYQDLLKQSVLLRLRSDRQVGTALSGGLDSATVAHYVNQAQVGNRQKTYSCVYGGERRIDESRNINLTLSRLLVSNVQVNPLNYNILEAVSKISEHMELPYDGTLLAPWFTYKIAKEDGTRVTLDGQGADELFGGYRSYLINYITASDSGLWRRFISVKQRADILFIASVLKKILNRKTVSSIYTSELNTRLLKDVKGYLSKHLMYGDRLSMAHGVESRLPFLDVNIVEWSFRLPAALKIYNGWTKYICRYSMSGILPEKVVWSKDKLGFPSPEIKIFSTYLKGDYAAMLSSSRLAKAVGTRDWVDPNHYRAAEVSKLIRQYNMLKIEKTMQI